MLAYNIPHLFFLMHSIDWRSKRLQLSSISLNLNWKGAWECKWKCKEWNTEIFKWSTMRIECYCRMGPNRWKIENDAITHRFNCDWKAVTIVFKNTYGKRFLYSLQLQLIGFPSKLWLQLHLKCQVIEHLTNAPGVISCRPIERLVKQLWILVLF